MMEYNDFLLSKTSLGENIGFDPVVVHDFLFDFQKYIVEFAIKKGRCAIFADCGMGKTPIELSYADNVVRKTGKKVLILTVMAVAQQFETEGEKFGIEVNKSIDGKPKGDITVTNYEKLHLFDPSDYTAVVADESSILKNFDGQRKKEITSFMRKMKYRILASATPAPNDFTELGTSSECLGYMGYIDMLNKYFKNTQNNSARGRIQGEVIKWRFKGHAEESFWNWVSGWSIAVRKPSDIGFDDNGFILPELTTSEHVVEHKVKRDDHLFALPAIGLLEQRQERRATINERCDKASELVNHKADPSIIWCHMNDEGDLLEKWTHDCVQISGKDSDEKKEAKFLRFINGDAKVLITKPRIGAWGLNFQHCNHMTFFPSHSFEQYYQAVRRCWRFGQERPVHVDVVTSEGERGVLNNLKRKEQDAISMFESLTGKVLKSSESKKITTFKNKIRLPKWL